MLKVVSVTPTQATVHFNAGIQCTYGCPIEEKNVRGKRLKVIAKDPLADRILPRGWGRDSRRKAAEAIQKARDNK